MQSSQYIHIRPCNIMGRVGRELVKCGGCRSWLSSDSALVKRLIVPDTNDPGSLAVSSDSEREVVAVPDEVAALSGMTKPF